MKTEYQMSEWTEIIRQRNDSGESIRKFCENRGIKKARYFYWQKKLRDAACEQLTSSQDIASLCFAEVNVSSPQLASLESLASGQLCIEVGEVRINADSAYPPAMLAALLRELR